MNKEKDIEITLGLPKNPWKITTLVFAILLTISVAYNFGILPFSSHSNGELVGSQPAEIGTGEKPQTCTCGCGTALDACACATAQRIKGEGT